MRRIALAALGVLGVLFSGGLAPAGQGPTNAMVRTFRGIERLEVEAVNAPTCRAWRIDAAGDKAAGPALSMRLSNRVVLRLGDARVGAALGARRLPGTDHFWVLDRATVREAIDSARMISNLPGVREAYVDSREPISLRTLPGDPDFFRQWHLSNALSPGFDANVEPAWDMGVTGLGVVIGVLEGGIQINHPDLAANFNAEASQVGGVSAHGTSVAGIAAAVANNGIGGAGAAYDAQVSRQYFGSVSRTAEAFGFRNDLNDIKNNSWGPSDDGRLHRISSVELDALREGVQTGRGGLGEVYVWAAGNGGTRDRVDYDPYASSRYTIAVGAIGDLDVRAFYNEQGSSLLTVAHSSGNFRSIFTTTSGSGFTDSFGGTSAAAPLASGVVALILQANPGLTWRDMQHVLVNSARMNDPASPSWTVNGAGHAISYDYGFGAVDAGAAVTLAQSWTNVGPETLVDPGVIVVGAQIPDDDPVGVSQLVQIDRDIRVEHVEVVLNVGTPFIGDLRIILTSPQGTESILATERSDPQDDLTDDVFTTVRNWDEPSLGTWTLTISDRQAGDVATWTDFRLLIYGAAAACPADLTGDGVLDAADLAAFIALFSASDPGADLAADGTIDVRDFFEFVRLFGEGCP